MLAVCNAMLKIILIGVPDSDSTWTHDYGVLNPSTLFRRNR